MNDDIHQKFTLISQTSELYGKDFSDGVIKIFLNSFKDIPYENLEKAVSSWTKESPFMFSVSQIRQLTRDMFPEVFQRLKSEPFTKSEWLEFCIKRDKEELGLDEEDYQEYVDHQEKQHREPYKAPGVDNLVFEEDQ